MSEAADQRAPRAAYRLRTAPAGACPERLTHPEPGVRQT